MVVMWKATVTKDLVGCGAYQGVLTAQACVRLATCYTGRRRFGLARVGVWEGHLTDLTYEHISLLFNDRRGAKYVLREGNVYLADDHATLTTFLKPSGPYEVPCNI